MLRIKLNLLLSILSSSTLLLNSSDIQGYIQKVEKENNISYEKILNTRGAYITSMCYTKTKDTFTNKAFNPCYSCHTKGKLPNYYNDTNLQEEYNFPKSVMKNPLLIFLKIEVSMWQRYLTILF